MCLKWGARESRMRVEIITTIMPTQRAFRQVNSKWSTTCQRWLYGRGCERFTNILDAPGLQGFRVMDCVSAMQALLTFSQYKVCNSLAAPVCFAQNRAPFFNTGGIVIFFHRNLWSISRIVGGILGEKNSIYAFLY